MSTRLVSIIRSEEESLRNLSLDAVCRDAGLGQLLAECAELEVFRRSSGNLYERVRALFFLYAIHRFHLPFKPGFNPGGRTPFSAYEHLLHRRFEEAIEQFLRLQEKEGPSEALSSGLADAYKKLGIQTLADQVKRSVRSTLGNQWMFRTGHPEDHPLHIRPELLRRDAATGLYPVLHESTPVRMDISHSGWSDIFFLGMDFPEGANVMNVSIDLLVRDKERPGQPRPPIETFLRIIDRPVLRLTSIDLNASADITQLADVFDFARDYLGLLKAAVIASGLVPPGLEGANQPLSELLGKLVAPGLGIEITSQVNGIPKGSRLAVSTNLLASLIGVCMRATGQARSLSGGLEEQERRLVAARAILGEWLGGSGGGWQDSGGVWPGIKLIQGVASAAGDPEWGVSRGRLLPQHTILDRGAVTEETRKKLQDSLILVHGGMAQDVGPVLEMVTEKYLLRSEKEWVARQEAIRIFNQLVGFPAAGRHRGRGAAYAQKLPRAHPDHHPLGGQPLYRDADPPGGGGLRRRLLGLLDARRHGGRRHGVHLPPFAESGGPGTPSGDHAPHQAGTLKRPCPSPWIRWSTIFRSTSGAPGPSCTEARPPCCPPGTTPSTCPNCSGTKPAT
jgi:hypothetical protein